MTIEIKESDIIIRPSAVDTFFTCAYSWGKTFLEGQRSMPNSRAAIGTGIHRAAEIMWLESMEHDKKSINRTAMLDAAVEAFEEEEKLGMSYGKDENKNTCISEIKSGTEAFIEDIVPFAQIPIAVEKRFTVDIDHPLVSGLSGTIDHLTKKTISDIKTSKRAPTVSNYSTQQSVYKYLANANGLEVENLTIQSIVLKKVPEGSIIPLEADVQGAKNLVNMMLDTLSIVAEGKIAPELILRPNPKHIYCSEAYCVFYGKCPATSTKATRNTQIMVNPTNKAIKL